MTITSVASNSSFREKSAWACLAATLAVFVPYFIYVFRLFARGELQAASVINAFSTAVVISIILQILLHIGIALRSREEEKDERDRAIEWKSFRNAYGVILVSSFMTIGCIVVLALPYGVQPSVPWLAPVFLSQVFLLCFVAAETTKYLTQVVCYRRGS